MSFKTCMTFFFNTCSSYSFWRLIWTTLWCFYGVFLYLLELHNHWSLLTFIAFKWITHFLLQAKIFLLPVYYLMCFGKSNPLQTGIQYKMVYWWYYLLWPSLNMVTNVKCRCTFIMDLDLFASFLGKMASIWFKENNWITKESITTDCSEWPRL